MEIRVFTLCDGAYNYNGKLTIVGTVDNIKVPKIPTLTSVGIAAKIALSPNEIGKKNITINFKSSNGELMVPEIAFEAETKDNLVIAGMIDNLNIKEVGDCVVELMIGKTLLSLPFKVVK